MAGERPLEANVARLNVRGMELLHLSRIGLAGGETRAQRIRYSQIRGRGPGTDHQCESVISMRFQIGDRYRVHGGDVLNVIPLRVYVLNLESVVLSTRYVPRERDPRVVDVYGLNGRDWFGI